MSTKLVVLGIALLSGCAAPTSYPADSLNMSADTWRLADHAPAIKSASCGAIAGLPEADISISAKPVELGGKLEGLNYAGGWHLTSDTKSFGGLSGLSVLPGGDLLTVSDRGAFFRIKIDDGAPVGTGTFALMRGDDDEVLEGKVASDAEGLDFRDGLAIVSFERDHRILAFDIDGCGSASRGIEIAKLPGEHSGKPLARIVARKH